MKKKILSLMWGVAFGWFCLGATAHVDSLITGIKIQGNQRIVSDTIQEYSGLSVGKIFSQTTLSQAIKSLYATGFFKDVRIHDHQGILTIQVTENPFIRQIVFEGNKALADKILKTDFRLQVGSLLQTPVVHGEVQRLLALYRLKGYFNARVVPKIIETSRGSVDLIFEIEEGDVARVESIRFVGNNAFSSWQLSSVISTKESVWWRFLSSDDVYDPDKLEMDRETLRKFYHDHGYIDYRLTGMDAELLPSGKGFVITFTVQEGEQYRYGDIKVENHIPALKDVDFNSRLSLTKGDWYSGSHVEAMIDVLTNAAEQKGHLFISVIPEPVMDTKEHRVDLTFHINQGPRIFVRSLNVQGNYHTVDSVIRRAFSLAEGDGFSAYKLDQSKENLESLGFFKKVDIKEKLVEGHPELLDIRAHLTEQDTGALRFSAGFSTVDNLLGLISYSERNLFGRAYQSDTSLEISRRRKRLSTYFSNPYFMDRNLLFGTGLDYNNVSNKDISSYSARSIGWNTFLGYHLSRYWSQQWAYSIRHTKIYNIAQDAFPLILEARQSYVSSAIKHTLAYDSRNHPFVPTRGFIISWSTGWSGLGGNVKYLENELNYKFYYPIYNQVIFSLEAKAARLHPLAGKPLPLDVRYLLGGQSLRGFDYGGVGPRGYDPRGKKNWSDSLGGDTLVAASAQINFPLGLPEDVPVSGHIFFDMGANWDTKIQAKARAYNAANPNAPVGVYNDRRLRMTTGLGLSWASPFGAVIGIDYAFILGKGKGDEVQRFLFSMGTDRL